MPANTSTHFLKPSEVAGQRANTTQRVRMKALCGADKLVSRKSARPARYRGAPSSAILSRADAIFSRTASTQISKIGRASVVRDSG